MKKRRAILYVRVSTDEQAEKGHSLAHQEEMLRKYCLINSIEIVAFFKEDYSAKTFDRPEFNKVLVFLRKNKGVADLLLFLKWDRFSRNAPEAYTMISQLHKLGVEPQGIEQPLNMEIPEQKFLLALYLTAPEVENDRRALNVIAGIRKAMKEGRYMGTAPYGYKRGRNERNIPIIIPNEKEVKFVQMSFEMLATGNYHIEELRHILNKKGMPLGRTRFWYMFRNPVYIGKVFVPAYKQEPEMIVKGVHDSIISDALYYEVQDVLEGRKRHLPASPFCQQEELPLRGFLQCPRCGKTLTGSASKGRSARYYYYHCKRECKERVKAIDANDEFFKVVCRIGELKKVFQTYELIMTDANKKYGQDKSADLKQAKTEMETYQKRLDNAQTLMLDGKIDVGEYQKIKTKLEPAIERLAVRVSELSRGNVDEADMIDFGFYFLNNMTKLFAEADLDRKRYIFGSTMPEKWVFENGKYRTASGENLLLDLANAGAALGNKKEGRRDLFRLPSRRVENTGVEPVTFCMPCKRSTR